MDREQVTAVMKYLGKRGGLARVKRRASASMAARARWAAKHLQKLVPGCLAQTTT